MPKKKAHRLVCFFFGSPCWTWTNDYCYQISVCYKKSRGFIGSTLAVPEIQCSLWLAEFRPLRPHRLASSATGGASALCLPTSLSSVGGSWLSNKNRCTNSKNGSKTKRSPFGLLLFELPQQFRTILWSVFLYQNSSNYWSIALLLLNSSIKLSAFFLKRSGLMQTSPYPSL